MYVFYWASFFGYFFYNKPEINFMHSPKHIEENTKNCFNSQAQDTTALQSNIFVTEIYQLLVTNKEMSAFPTAKHCQGQL
jgi:hypothetical protein